MLLVIGVIIIPYVFYNIRLLVPYPVKSNLKLHDYYIIIILLVYLVIGIYQQYFWTKQNKLRKTTIQNNVLDIRKKGNNKFLTFDSSKS